MLIVASVCLFGSSMNFVVDSPPLLDGKIESPLVAPPPLLDRGLLYGTLPESKLFDIHRCYFWLLSSLCLASLAGSIAFVRFCYRSVAADVTTDRQTKQDRERKQGEKKWSSRIFSRQAEPNDLTVRLVRSQSLPAMEDQPAPAAGEQQRGQRQPAAKETVPCSLLATIICEALVSLAAMESCLMYSTKMAYIPGVFSAGSFLCMTMCSQIISRKTTSRIAFWFWIFPFSVVAAAPGPTFGALFRSFPGPLASWVTACLSAVSASFTLVVRLIRHEKFPRDNFFVAHSVFSTTSAIVSMILSCFMEGWPRPHLVLGAVPVLCCVYTLTCIYGQGSVFYL